MISPPALNAVLVTARWPAASDAVGASATARFPQSPRHSATDRGGREHEARNRIVAGPHRTVFGRGVRANSRPLTPRTAAIRSASSQRYVTPTR